jgi:hypothetical protein
MPVQTVFENLEAGLSVDEITEVFDVTREEVKAVLHFASQSLAKAPSSLHDNSGRWKFHSTTEHRSRLPAVSPATKSLLRGGLAGTNLKTASWFKKAEEAGYDVLVSTDKNIQYQQDLTGWKIALVIFGNQQWPLVKLHLDKIAAAVDAATPGSFSEVDIPFD